jgi:hypothetical protein
MRTLSSVAAAIGLCVAALVGSSLLVVSDSEASTPHARRLSERVTRENITSPLQVRR